MDADVSNLGVALSAVLVLVAIGISFWRRLGLEIALVVSSLRALAQLAVMGLVLAYLIAPEQPLVLSWIWVAVMVAFAGWTVHRRAPDAPAAAWLAVRAFGLASVATLGVLLGLGVFPVEGRTIVPLAGLMIGNSMSATVLAARRTLDQISDDRLDIEARLALGQPSAVASQPLVRSAIRTALIPQIETTRAVGIIFLPGAMVGLLLAGVEPVGAIRVQLAVMYLILGAAAISASTMALGIARRSFTDAHQLVVRPRTASPR